MTATLPETEAPEVRESTRFRHRADDNQREQGLFHDPERMARLLGWFSIGLGLSQLVAPRGVTRMVGMEDTEGNHKTMRAFGLREFASGVGILSRPGAAGWLWGRVAGDAMDLAVLGRALNSDRSDRNRVAAATAAVVGVTLLDYLTGRQLGESDGESHRAAAGQRGVHVSQAVTVNRPAEEVYRFWRDFGNLPRFMEHLESVEVIDERRSHWKAAAPAGSTVEWDAEIVEDVPNERIAWRSVQDADVENRGTVRFLPAPGGRGTEIHVDLRYEPPGGRLGALVAKLFGEEPSQQVNGDLRRLKQVLETGEVVHSDASIHTGMHPARPSDETRSAGDRGGVR
jgi:uncharacterized membrane protein